MGQKAESIHALRSDPNDAIYRRTNDNNLRVSKRTQGTRIAQKEGDGVPGRHVGIQAAQNCPDFTDAGNITKQKQLSRPRKVTTVQQSVMELSQVVAKALPKEVANL